MRGTNVKISEDTI